MIEEDETKTNKDVKKIIKIYFNFFIRFAFLSKFSSLRLSAFHVNIPVKTRDPHGSEFSVPAFLFVPVGFHPPSNTITGL